jgi:CubicO group peptidase (beta-lactamase class C family)
MTLAPRLLVCALLAALLPAQAGAARIAARVDAYFAPLCETGLFSGAVLIARSGTIVVQKAWGFADLQFKVPNTADTRFKLMSTSKTLTGVTVMRLVQDGKLELTDPVGKHLPEWPKEWRAVTVHDLLDHTSGIPNLENEWSMHCRNSDERGLAVWRGFAAQAGRPLANEPGRAFRYSNFNTVLAGCVAEAASGKSYRELVQASVLEPAGMKATGFDDGGRHEGLAVGCFLGEGGAPEPGQQDMSLIQPAGGFWSTVGDLYRFDRALRDDRLLDRAIRERMVTPRQGTYACCWSNEPVHGRACIQHSGGANGYVADFLRFPDDDACIVVLSNHAFAPILRISHDLAAILFGVAYDQPVVCDAALLDACCGVYRQPGAPVTTVIRRCGRLLLEYELRPGSERCGGRVLVPVGEAAFAEPMGAGRLAFDPGAEPPRLRRVAAQGDTVLPRLPVPLAEWQGACGILTATPQIGKRAELARDGDRLWLRIEGGWPGQVEVVPVDAGLAIALYAVDGGTLLHREGKLFRWQCADGTDVRLEPK